MLPTQPQFLTLQFARRCRFLVAVSVAFSLAG